MDVSWSRRWDSNPKPAVYKTAALPIELRRRDGQGLTAEDPSAPGNDRAPRGDGSSVGGAGPWRPASRLGVGPWYPALQASELAETASWIRRSAADPHPTIPSRPPERGRPERSCGSGESTWVWR